MAVLMRRLNAELSRLYLVPDPASAGQEQLLATNGTVKAMVLEIARPADWAALSAVWHGVQDDLQLPAAAIAVSGTDGLQLWFSVADPVPAQDAGIFLQSLQNRYLPELPARRIGLYPCPASDASAAPLPAVRVPARHEASGNWSAFVSPDLASVFGDEPWLDLPPNPDQQADILARLKPMRVAQFRELVDHWRTAPHPNAGPAAPPAEALPSPAAPLPQGRSSLGPQAFLLQVMNDPAVALQDRIEAAKALLPYSRETR